MLNILENKSLKIYNTFSIDVKARYFIEVNSVEELNDLFIDEFYGSLPRLILGGGSNILFTQNFDGIVIKLNVKGVFIEKELKETILIRANSGEIWHDFILWTLSNGYGGLENMSLIPGNVGTAPMQNIGAYGIEIKDVFVSLEAFDVETRKTRSFSLDECNFGYRESVFKRKFKDRYIILSVTFKLTKKNHLIKKSYGDIQNELDLRNIKDPSIKDISNVVIKIRENKLPNPKILGNSGSFFKNPIISIEDLNSIKLNHPTIKFYPMNDGFVKIAAGWLIDDAGWKGKRVGDAGVHDKQALVLVNYGNATGQDIYNLSQEIINDIKSKYKIIIEREVNIL